MYELASDARNTANPAISSGVDPLPKEQFFKKLFLDTSFSNNAALSLVFTYPGLWENQTKAALPDLRKSFSGGRVLRLGGCRNTSGTPPPQSG